MFGDIILTTATAPTSRELPVPLSIVNPENVKYFFNASTGI